MVGINKNKRGWMRILEATVAVLIVSGVLIVVYSSHIDKGIAPSEYFFSLQRQILADVSTKSDLRLAILNAKNDTIDNITRIPQDGNFSVIYYFIGNRTPQSFGYSVRVCDLNATACKMNTDDYVKTLDRGVFVEDLVISSELGVGSNAVYKTPKKLRFFIWELR